jgi:catechol 2,3-dioxygenase-like lactoylglutathione lyase family enzyme
MLYLNQEFPMRAHFILYVADQKRSRDFYAVALGIQPELDVPGMTEFHLGTGAVLGLMPEAGIRRLLGESLPDPSAGRGCPRAELYLVVEDAGAFHRRALSAGARELSPLIPRDWGHEAAYSLDPDGHVVAFAREVHP